MPGDAGLRGVKGRSLVVRGAEFAALIRGVIGEQQHLRECAREQLGLPSARAEAFAWNVASENASDICRAVGILTDLLGEVDRYAKERTALSDTKLHERAYWGSWRRWASTSHAVGVVAMRIAEDEWRAVNTFAAAADALQYAERRVAEDGKIRVKLCTEGINVPPDLPLELEVTSARTHFAATKVPSVVETTRAAAAIAAVISLEVFEAAAEAEMERSKHMAMEGDCSGQVVREHVARVQLEESARIAAIAIKRAEAAGKLERAHLAKVQRERAAAAKVERARFFAVEHQSATAAKMEAARLAREKRAMAEAAVKAESDRVAEEESVRTAAAAKAASIRYAKER